MPFLSGPPTGPSPTAFTCLSYAERHRAREAGFRWNEPLRGAWSRRLSQRDVTMLTFPVELADPEGAPTL